MFDQLHPSEHTPVFLNQVCIEARSYWNCTASETVRAGCVRYSAFTTGHKSSPRAGGQREGKEEREKQGAALLFYKGHRQNLQAWSLDMMCLASYFCFTERKKNNNKGLTFHSSKSGQRWDWNHVCRRRNCKDARQLAREKRSQHCGGVSCTFKAGSWETGSNLPVKAWSTKQFGVWIHRFPPTGSSVCQGSEYQGSSYNVKKTEGICTFCNPLTSALNDVEISTTFWLLHQL